MTKDGVGGERASRVVALLEDNVRNELQVTNGGFDLGLSEETIERLMQGVTSGLLYAFAVDWSPDWVKAGHVHHWEESGRSFAVAASASRILRLRLTRKLLPLGPKITRSPTDTTALTCRDEGG